ncbi:MAG: glycosyltransferase family 4 protein [Fibrobacteria bacterium]|nr:glycosyltransferase family 4 protein [Fibrobacteria bacterium]
MRVLIIGTSWPPETFLLRLFNGLSTKGLQLTLACQTKPESVTQNHKNFTFIRTFSWNCPLYIRIPIFLYLCVKNILCKPKSGYHLIQVIRQSFNPKEFYRQLYIHLPFCGTDHDVIYFPWNAAAIAHQALFAIGIPVIISCRGAQVNIAPHNPRRSALRQGLHDTLPLASAVHCVSKHIKQEAMHFGLPSDRTYIINPAIDPELFFPLETIPKHNEFTIISVGSLIWRKGYEYALQAIKILVNQGIPVRYEIIGTGPESERIFFTIQDLELKNYVHVSGPLPPEAVVSRLQHADAFLLASLSEGISNAALEAMACALPVVSTDCGGMRETIGQKSGSILVPVRNPVAMARALAHLYEEPIQRLEMGKAARTYVINHHTLEKQINAFTHMLRLAIQVKNKY